MKLMTYNILDGGEERLPLVIDAINKEAPDYLTINEANGFEKNNNEILKKISKAVDLPYFDIALSGEYDYHVAVFSRYQLTNTHKTQPLMRACVITDTESDLGTLSIASLHLSPYSEDLRNAEIDRIIRYQKKFNRRILMGDMNSLSRYDSYNPTITKVFNEAQANKFTRNGKLRFEAVDKILSTGYYDTAVQLGKNKEDTVPTRINKDAAHADMRLDYIFISTPLLPHLQNYSVIKNKLTDKASDHYPVVVTLK